MSRLLAITITWFATICCSFAQTEWRISQLDVSDGLSQGYIYEIYQDKRGFIWIGTHGGLNRYDGYRFKVFQYDPFNAATLADNAVFFLEENPVTGKFWIGGSSALNEFDPVTFVNTRYRYPGKQLEFSDGVFLNDHEILLACQDAVMLFDTQKRSFTPIPVIGSRNEPVTLTRAENVSRDRHGNVMVMSRNGIFFYDSASRTCQRRISSGPDFSPLAHFEVFDVLQDHSGNYWVATNKEGLIHFNNHTKAIRRIVLPIHSSNRDLRFDEVMEDKDGTIWAGSTNGLFRIDAATFQFEHFSTEGSPALGHNEINVIYQDRNRFMWVGTVGNGVNKMIPRNKGFKNYRVGINEENMTGSYIMALEQLGDDVWFMNIWDQVGRIDTRTGKYEIVSPEKFQGAHRWFSEGTLIKTGKKELSMLNGEFLFRISDNSRDGSVNVVSSPGLSYMRELRNGRRLSFVEVPAQGTFIRNDTIYGNQFFFDAKEDKQGRVWIGTSKGLIRFIPSENSFTQYRHNDQDSTSISSDFIYDVEIDDQQNVIWMAAYNGGLCAYDIGSNSFKHFSKDDGLADNSVYAIERDRHGSIWFTSNAGISAYDVRTKSFRHFSVADGLLNHEFNRRAGFTNPEGWIFFGGVLGIDYFHPDSISTSHIESSLSFTGFKIGNADYHPATETEPVLDLRPDNRLITLEFSSLDYSDPQKIQYAYRFENESWITAGTQNTLSFSKFSTGDHRLYIRSTNRDGVWLNNEIACRIVVHPWWWQSWWFRSVLGVLTVVAIAGAIHFYFRRKLQAEKAVLERKRAIERERTRIATDMHDDLGANLSRIKFLSETIEIKRELNQPIQHEIKGIRQYAHEMIDKMGEIVWALNEKNDTLSDLLAYTRAYAVEYLTQNGIEPEVQISELSSDLFVSGEFRRNVFLAVKEALHNIVKHAQATRVSIVVGIGKQLTIRIHDNGVGFNEATIRPFANGLGNMKKRMRALKGTMEIQNSIGSTVILAAPLT